MDDFEDDSPSETTTCPSCGAEVYEDAVVCPVCNEYVTHRSFVFRGRPLWYVLLAAAGILAAVWMFLT